MSKEATAGDKCACGQLVAFPTYHWPHCPANPMNMDKETLAKIEEKFTKTELAIIASHGPTVETLQASVAPRDKTKGKRKVSI